MPVFSTAEGPMGLVPESARAVCSRLDSFSCEPNLLADLILGPGERQQWMSMHAVQKRRHEWLLGRCAAKDAVRRLLEKHLNLQLSPREIEIVPIPTAARAYNTLVSSRVPSPRFPLRTAKASLWRWRLSFRG